MKNIVKVAGVLLLGASSCHFTLAAEEGSNEVVPQLTVAQQLKEAPQLTIKPQFKAPEQRAGKHNSLAEQAARYNQRLQAMSNADAAALCEQLLAAHSNANRTVNLDNTGKEKLLEQMAGRNCDEYAAELLQREKNASRQLHRRSVDRNKLKAKQQSRAASRVGGEQ